MKHDLASYGGIFVNCLPLFFFFKHYDDMYNDMGRLFYFILVASTINQRQGENVA